MDTAATQTVDDAIIYSLTRKGLSLMEGSDKTALTEAGVTGMTGPLSPDQSSGANKEEHRRGGLTLQIWKG